MAHWLRVSLATAALAAAVAGQDLPAALCTPEEQDRALAAAIAAEAEGSFEEALALLEDVIEREPANVTALLHRGRILCELECYPEAERDLLQCLLLAPGEPALHLVAGILYHRWQHYPEAAAHFAECCRLLPGDGWIRNFLGNLEAGAGRLKSARAFFVQASELLPREPEPSLNLARLDLHLGRSLPATLALARLCSRFPRDPTVRLAYAEALQEIGCEDIALEELHRVVQFPEEEHRETRCNALRLLGSLYRAQERTDAAIACFEEAILQGDDPQPIFDDLALLYQRVGRGEDAAELLRLAVRMEGRTDDRVQLARVLEELGDPAGALEQLRHVWASGARRPDLLAALSRMEERCGNEGDAERYFEELLRLGREHSVLAHDVGYQLAVAERSLCSRLPRVWSRQRGEESVLVLRSMAEHCGEPAREELEQAVRALHASSPERAPGK